MCEDNKWDEQKQKRKEKKNKKAVLQVQCLLPFECVLLLKRALQSSRVNLRGKSNERRGSQVIKYVTATWTNNRLHRYFAAPIQVYREEVHRAYPYQGLPLNNSHPRMAMITTTR